MCIRDRSYRGFYKQAVHQLRFIEEVYFHPLGVEKGTLAQCIHHLGCLPTAPSGRVGALGQKGGYTYYTLLYRVIQSARQTNKQTHLKPPFPSPLPFPSCPGRAWRRGSHFTRISTTTVSYTHLRAHETPEHLVCRLLLEKKKKKKICHSSIL
eukprot:TRINITY_DN7525_c0_g1_i2.p1 TRINITY_DN7525_c0_g1~~TRINITY_DN7525_c0_g1_i2.p1  ORF type:complete len:153 (+),score=13.60 TRINITY_DN7525_c0_g1_i2:186-644(+)